MAFKDFRAAVRGWMTLDGDDYCPACWERFLEEMGEFRNVAASDSSPLDDREIAKTRRVADGWFTDCHGCGQIISMGRLSV